MQAAVKAKTCRNCYLALPVSPPLGRCPSCGAPTDIVRHLLSKAKPWTEAEARCALAEAKSRLEADMKAR